MKKCAFLIAALLVAASCSTPVISSEPASEAVESVIMSRRSVRKYVDQPVSRDTLDVILNAGINAPNGQNRQAYEVRVVDNPRFLEGLSKALQGDGTAAGKASGSIFFGAPCVVFIANDTSYDMSQVDCGLLGENIILSAWSMGIGSCCMAGPIRQMKESEACRPYMEKLGFSEGCNLLYCITLGYPAESPSAKPRKAEKILYLDEVL